MFKVWLRRFLKELFCSHKNLSVRTMDIGLQTFNTTECLECGKAWVKEI